MMTVDSHQLRTLTLDLIQTGPRGVALITPIMKKAAQNIKNAMRKDVQSHPHFKQLAPTINYDIRMNAVGGVGSIEAEIGYDKDVAGGVAALAGIAIFGSSKPGGGTVRDPMEALQEEAPNAEQWIAEAMDGLL